MQGTRTQPTSGILDQTRRVIDYRDDGSRPGRPLGLLIGGGAVALVSMALMLSLAYQTWYLGEIDTDRGYFGVSFLFAIYVFGLFLFCYGFHTYDAAKALKLTLILTVVSVVALLFIVAVFAALAKLKAVGSFGDPASGAGDRTGPYALSLGGLLMGEEAPATGEPESDLFLIHCQGCGAGFIPIPPAAICPECGRAAATAG